MTIQESIEYINAHTWSQWKLGLSRTEELLALLGNPQKQLRFIHVAGSNGKGSTCAMLERILREAGYVTGLYPSPYIEDFRERIQVCGEYITEEALCRITERVKGLADGMEDHPTQFELITAIGMAYFAEKKCDLVVLEVGLGGLYDSTNVIDAPEAAVITNIGLEHTEYLGDTLAEIAANKCGIIKSGADVVCYENLPEVMEVVRRTCEEKGCPLHIARYGRIVPLERSLEGQTFLFLKNSVEKNLPPAISKTPSAETETEPAGTAAGENGCLSAETMEKEALKKGSRNASSETGTEPVGTAAGENGCLSAETMVQASVPQDGKEDLLGIQRDDSPESVPQDGKEGLIGIQRDDSPESVSQDGKEGDILRLALLGEYQLHNAATVLTVVEALRGRGFKIPEEAVRKGMENVRWPARFEVLSRNPLFILDGGHNPQCAGALAESLRTYLPEAEGRDAGSGKIVFLMGMLADKDYLAVIDIISPFAAAFVCLTPDSPRALSAEDLAQELRGRGFTAAACKNAREGIEKALQKRLPVVAFGSLYMAGEVRSDFSGALKACIRSRKMEQRKEAISRRRSLTAEERAEKSRAVCRILKELPQLKSADTVFSYAAASDEVNLDEINRCLEKRGKRVCYPVCQKGGIMDAVIPESGNPEAWHTGAYGIREPVREMSAPVLPGEIDAVIIPCVVFDRKGGRCGHGAGFYDRYLEQLSPETARILVAFDCQETDRVAEEETDVKMHAAVTESGALFFD